VEREQHPDLNLERQMSKNGTSASGEKTTTKKLANSNGVGIIQTDNPTTISSKESL
jgi:hypothetical protein